ncbi:TPA: aminoacyl-tRNA hydrolase [Candidatus Saccharibacteria bacterium]|nr:MAG: pth, peptidyl-tRNA hydrolase [Candidatus Saccharibacteria bacterium GW2011_GWC2_44_17]OGL34198.1 MAG: aminoacyl-tRNA hydrolase [Candidatus Saccharibacteria bacterium RIFCSPHIGHO2_12_FULL_47_16]HBH77997.1 aminoacyl-tRNA hydrolase [Candidatus Saccharibacteria bacterium]
MKIIFAQGNPGLQYQNTRHNVGFLALDHFADSAHVSFQQKSKFHADIAELTHDGEKHLLVKPLTFYNETGQSARILSDFYKVSSSDILVIHDDLALPFGTLRTREKGSDAGNNGIKSLNSHLGQEYARIRVGIRTELADRIDSADFVLARFSREEASKLDEELFPKIDELIEKFLSGTHDNTSHYLF